MPDWLPVLLLVSVLTSESAAARRGRAAHYWNITHGDGLSGRRDGVTGRRDGLSGRAPDHGDGVGGRALEPAARETTFPLQLPAGSLFSVSTTSTNTFISALAALLWDCNKSVWLQWGGVTEYPSGLSNHLRHPEPWVQIILHDKGRLDGQAGGDWGQVGFD